MENQIFTREAQTIVEAAGMRFDIFQRVRGKYGEYSRKSIADFISMSEVDYSELVSYYRLKLVAELD